ncbi:ROK family transcriptional regulator [Ruminococcus albus]|uniref:Sugar kinase of the NBD/HSP70 family, may contain an N-terminal HTH domain n=1 Tax=Ruminococcus albus TaxID=1264 RepID=A0A1I1ESW1_RUMAL|nr:ROK family transcriptional regulator [Ruminococcus albus]SFB89792.1 Sugar kinase of the NBD/HSP70 family, may contain an N-terminal HTH domain [Ruminococcus albus]
MEQHGISKLDLKRRNRMQVLKILKQRGPTSRIDIAGTLELTRAAVTIITNEMIEQGIIQEIGEYKHITEKAPRGRKKILIDINHHYKFVIGVTLEEDIVSVGLSTLAGAVLDKRNLSIDHTIEYNAIFDFVRKSIKEVLADNCLDKNSILGIGFGVFPTMYEKLGVEVKDGIPDYSKVRNLIRGYTDLPLVFDNSVKGTAMANIDFLKTKDPNRQNIAFLQYGNNMNFVVTNLNEPIVSYDNRTGFVDKMIINPYSERVCEKCGRRGCVENEITPSATFAKLSEVYSPDRTPYLYEASKGSFKNIKMDMVQTAYDKDDPAVKEVIDSEIKLTAVLINNLYFSTNPQKIVLHHFTNHTNSEVDFNRIRNALNEIGGPLVAGKIETSIIEDKHRFLSGCALAIRELFFNRGGFDANS